MTATMSKTPLRHLALTHQWSATLTLSHPFGPNQMTTGFTAPDFDGLEDSVVGWTMVSGWVQPTSANWVQVPRGERGSNHRLCGGSMARA